MGDAVASGNEARISVGSPSVSLRPAAPSMYRFRLYVPPTPQMAGTLRVFVHFRRAHSGSEGRAPSPLMCFT